MNEVTLRAERAVNMFEALCREFDTKSSSFGAYEAQLESVKGEQALAERARNAMGDVRQVLTKSSLEFCEQLANLAIESIFGLPYKVRYSIEESKFVLDRGEFCVDLSKAEGGGLQTVVSFVFSLYLVIKQGCRRLMFFDEAFTQISDEYLPAFLSFVNNVCKDLGFDILLVTHDERISLDSVNRAYFVSDGVCTRIK